MLTLDDMNSIEDALTSSTPVKVAHVDTKKEGTVEGVVHVTPEKPGDPVLFILVLWDGDNEAKAIKAPSNTIELVNS